MRVVLDLLLASSLVARCRSQHSDGAGRLVHPRLAGYQPKTKVVDYAGLDQDQKAMEDELDYPNMLSAHNMYQLGGNSYPVARLTLEAAESILEPFPPGTVVDGDTMTGEEARGELQEELMWYTNGEDVQVEVPYHIISDRLDYARCRVGGLYSFGEADARGCFNATGVVRFQASQEAEPHDFDYHYNVVDDNFNRRTLQTLSTDLLIDTAGTARFEELEKFKDYYGTYVYGEKLLHAYFLGTTATLRSDYINGHFLYDSSWKVLIRRATVTMNVWMYIVHKMQAAQVECPECEDVRCSAINHWDAAVALYVGSLHEEDGSGDGNFMYALANKECVNFRTCGPDGNDVNGIAWVNQRVLKLLGLAQQALFNRQCGEPAAFRRRIVPLMMVPLIQGTLRAAYARAYGESSSDEEAENQVAESIILSASVVPFIHECNPKDADTIVANLDAANKNVDFAAVKAAFEHNYQCLLITCDQVGGLWEDGKYKPGAEACGMFSSSSGKTSGTITAVFTVTLFVLGIGGAVYWIHKKQRIRTNEFPSSVQSGSVMA